MTDITINSICDNLKNIIASIKTIDEKITNELKEIDQLKKTEKESFCNTNNDNTNIKISIKEYIPAGSLKPQINMANNRWVDSLRD